MVSSKKIVAAALLVAPALVTALSRRELEYDLLSTREYSKLLLSRKLNTIRDELEARAYERTLAQAKAKRDLLDILFDELETRGLEARTTGGRTLAPHEQAQLLTSKGPNTKSPPTTKVTTDVITNGKVNPGYISFPFNLETESQHSGKD